MDTLLLFLKLKSADPVRKTISDPTKVTEDTRIEMAFGEPDKSKEESHLWEKRPLQAKDL